MRLRSVLTALLAALLLLQWGTAFASCLQPAAVFSLTICTPEGLRQVAIPLDQHEGGEHGLAADLACPACLGPAAVALPAPPVALAPPLLLVQSADPPPPPAPSPVPFPPRACQPRAPPPTS